MKNRQLYLINIAFFMIFLIVTLPMYSANAFAASTIQDVTATGSAGIPGFRALTDTTTITVTVDIPDDAEIGPGQVKILQDPTAPFECSPLEGTIYLCTREYAENTVSSTLEVAAFTIQIFDDSMTPISAATPASIMVDSLPPSITDLGASVISRGADGTILGHYSVTDKSCKTAGCVDKCAGVASIKFTVGGAIVGTVDPSLITTDCTQTGETNLTGLAVGGSVQVKHLCTESSDVLGQASTVCRDVTIDAKAPEITGFELKDSSGMTVKNTNGQPLSGVYLEINITEDSGLYNPVNDVSGQIFLNASALSEYPEHQLGYGNLGASCFQTTTTTYTCKSPQLILIATSQKDISIGIKARDLYNNTLDTTKSVSLLFDNIPPVPTRIYSNWIDVDGQNVLREDSNIVSLDIVDSGSGVGNKQMFIDFTSLGAGQAMLAPNDCTAGWTCNWRYISTKKTSGTTLSLSTALGSKDDAANLMATTLSGVFLVDVDAPCTPSSTSSFCSKYKDALAGASNMTGIGEGHDPMMDITGGDALDIHLFVADTTGVRSARANFSDVVLDGANDVEGTCTLVDVADISGVKVYDCFWQTSAVLSGYVKDAQINFTFEDFANHTSVYSWDDIEILGKENETIPRWSVTVRDYSPGNGEGEPGLDRLSWALSAPRVFYVIDFKAEGNPIPISVTLEKMSCTNADYVNADPATGEFAINLFGFVAYDMRPEPPFTDSVEIDFNPGAVPPMEQVDPITNATSEFTGFNITCTFVIQSIVPIASEKYLTMPELVNVTFPVKLYNNDLGNNYGNVLDEIKHMQNHVKKLWKWTVYLRRIFKIAEQLCKYIELLIKIDALIAGVKGLFDSGCKAGPTSAVACSTQQSLAYVMKGNNGVMPSFIKEVYRFCGLFISCRVTAEPKTAIPNEDGGYDCPKDDGWCTVQSNYGKIVGWMGNLANKYVMDNIDLQITGNSEDRVFGRIDFDPKQSIFSSILTLCIPGIIYNLDKFMQIYCQKLLCYKIDVAAGNDVWKCDATYAYLLCTHIVGQVFAAIPFLQYWDQIGQLISNIFKNPFMLIGLVWDVGCDAMCECTGEYCPAAVCGVCRGTQFAMTIFNIVYDLYVGAAYGFQSAWADLCEESLKKNPKMTNLPIPPAGTGSY